MTEDQAREQRTITEAEYRAWLEQRMPIIAAELTEMLPQELRDAGMWFDYVSESNVVHLEHPDAVDEQPS